MIYYISTRIKNKIDNILNTINQKMWKNYAKIAKKVKIIWPKIYLAVKFKQGEQNEYI